MNGVEEIAARMESERLERQRIHLDAFISSCGGLEPAIEMAVRERDAAAAAVVALEARR